MCSDLFFFLLSAMTCIEIDTPKYVTCDKVRQATGLQIQFDMHSKEDSFKRTKGLKPKNKVYILKPEKKKKETAALKRHNFPGVSRGEDDLHLLQICLVGEK